MKENLYGWNEERFYNDSSYLYNRLGYVSYIVHARL